MFEKHSMFRNCQKAGFTSFTYILQIVPTLKFALLGIACLSNLPCVLIDSRLTLDEINGQIVKDVANLKDKIDFNTAK